MFFYNYSGRNIEKDIQNYGKNFPVNTAWVPAFAGMTAWGGAFGFQLRKFNNAQEFSMSSDGMLCGSGGIVIAMAFSPFKTFNNALSML